jgi:hypothetical protein
MTDGNSKPGKPARRLKLYIWEDAFADYYPGIAVALAYDVREARRLIVASYGTNSDYARRELAARPEVIRLDEKTRPRAWQVSGGG